MKRLRVIALVNLIVLITVLMASCVISRDAGACPKTYKVTAYCDCSKCCGKEDGITSTGTIATEGRTVAVDPDVIPYGSTVMIYYKHELVGIYIAEDCGGAIAGNRLDLYFDTHEDALMWGVKECEIVVYEGKG